jgi:hypothetical protein
VHLFNKLAIRHVLQEKWQAAQFSFSGFSSPNPSAHKHYPEIGVETRFTPD